MNKPNWEVDAPEWANYLAQDSDGNWCWYESRPEWSGDCWLTDSGRECYHSDRDPEDTLEQRPC